MKRYVKPDPIEGSHAELEPDQRSVIPGVLDAHPVDGQPCYRFDVPDDIPNDNGAWLRIRWDRGYSPYELHGHLDTVTTGARSGFAADIFRGQKFGSVRPFRLDGHFCRYSDDGTEMLINESTGFRLFERFRSGSAKADAFAESCVGHRINFVRSSGMQDTSLYLPDPHLQYRIFPDDDTYYRDLSDYLDWCEGWGLYNDFVCCMQTETLMPDPARQRRHVAKCFEVFHDRYGIVSKVNEQRVHDNSVDESVLAMPKPAGATFILSTGSQASGVEDALEPLGDAGEIHYNDSNEWWRKGHNAMENAGRYKRAWWISETTRTDKEDARVGQAAALIHYEDDGKTQTAMSLASIIHTQEGKNADPFGYSVPHVQAHNRGVFAVDLPQRRGPYRRYDNPAVLREYSMGNYRWQVRF